MRFAEEVVFSMTGFTHVGRLREEVYAGCVALTTAHLTILGPGNLCLLGYPFALLNGQAGTRKAGSTWPEDARVVGPSGLSGLGVTTRCVW